MQEVDVPDELEIKCFSEENDILKHRSSAKYVISSSINHIGPNLESGHYTFTVRDPLSNNWHLYDDETVSSLKFVVIIYLFLLDLSININSIIYLYELCILYKVYYIKYHVIMLYLLLCKDSQNLSVYIIS
jgi:uncharacterized UBP type Zn finger protein